MLFHSGHHAYPDIRVIISRHRWKQLRMQQTQKFVLVSSPLIQAQNDDKPSDAFRYLVLICNMRGIPPAMLCKLDFPSSLQKVFGKIRFHPFS